MTSWKRRIRGALGMGLTWAAVWGAAGVGMAIVTRFQADAPFPLVFAVFGFAAGVIFSACLAMLDGRRRFDQLSMPSIAGRGAVGGVVLAAIFAKAASLGWGDVLVVAPTFAFASAVAAAGSLALARRAGARALSEVEPHAPDAALHTPERKPQLP